MTEATKRLRDPAALALVAFVVVELVLSIFDLLAGSGTTFSDRAAGSALSILDVTHVGALVGALVLVYAFGEESRYARLVTQIALAAYGLSLVFGVTAVCGALASDNSGHARTDVFLSGIVLLVVFAVGGWFTWLVYQKNAPAKPAPQAGWPAPQAGYQPWGGGQGNQQQGQGYQQQPPPGGYGWPQQQPQSPYQQPQFPEQQSPQIPQQQSGQAPMGRQGGSDLTATQVGGPAPMPSQPQPQSPVAPSQPQSPVAPSAQPGAPAGEVGTQVMPAVDEPGRGAPSQGVPQGGPAPWAPTIGGAQDARQDQGQNGGQGEGGSDGVWRPEG